MLRTLTARSMDEVRGLLSQATLSLLPHAEDIVVDDDVKAVLAEVRERLRIPPTDSSADARTKVQTFLGDLLADQLLPKSERPEVRRRLGEKGLLAPNQFDIQSNPALTARGALYRAKRSHVENAIQHADVTEHFRVVEGAKDVPFTSLFMHRPLTKPPNTFWWLIECQRIGASVRPNHAWRLFDDTFDFTTIRTPREAIIAFAQQFGNDMKIGNKLMRIAFREVVQNPGEGKPFTLIEVPGLKVEAKTSEREGVIGFSYAINNVKYSGYLDAHKVPPT
jgi:hypothetical protein